MDIKTNQGRGHGVRTQAGSEGLALAEAESEVCEKCRQSSTGEAMEMRLGDKCFKERLYVAPRRPDISLGHDLWTGWRVKINGDRKRIVIDYHHIPLNAEYGRDAPGIAGVTAAGQVITSPQATTQVEGNVEEEL